MPSLIICNDGAVKGHRRWQYCRIPCMRQVCSKRQQPDTAGFCGSAAEIASSLQPFRRLLSRTNRRNFRIDSTGFNVKDLVPWAFAL